MRFCVLVDQETHAIVIDLSKATHQSTHFMDASKAFDTIDHYKLFEKLLD